MYKSIFKMYKFDRIASRFVYIAEICYSIIFMANTWPLKNFFCGELLFVVFYAFLHGFKIVLAAHLFFGSFSPNVMIKNYCQLLIIAGLEIANVTLDITFICTHFDVLNVVYMFTLLELLFAIIYVRRFFIMQEIKHFVYSEFDTEGCCACLKK